MTSLASTLKNEDIGFAVHDALSVLTDASSSKALEIRSSETSGRGVFSKNSLSNGMTILRTNDVDQLRLHREADESQHNKIPDIGGISSPVAYTIFREYRKEVCGDCFRYDRGRDWKIKLDLSLARRRSQQSSAASMGVVFCSADCGQNWLQRYGTLGVEAFIAMEDSVKKVAKRNGSTITTNAADQNGDQHVSNSHSNPTQQRSENSVEEIKTAWARIDAKSKMITNARTKQDPSKADRKTLRSATEPNELNGDVCYYLLTGVLNAYVSAQSWDRAKYDNIATKLNGHKNATSAEEHRQKNLDNISSDPAPTKQSSTIDPTTSCSVLQSIRSLAPDPNCYNHPASTMSIYESAYLLLYATLPLPLLPHLTPVFAHEMNLRAGHNAFSIRPCSSSDGDQSGEMLGWGVWPEASFFNHSCASNVGKKRVGRTWEFYIDKRKKSEHGFTNGLGGCEESVSPGEELCITYLGGDEWDLDVVERRKRLKQDWGFECMCERCCDEDRKRTTILG